jgi:hypothetical protein
LFLQENTKSTELQDSSLLSPFAPVFLIRVSLVFDPWLCLAAESEAVFDRSI